MSANGSVQSRLEKTLTAIYHLGQELVLTRDPVQIARSVVNAARQMLNFEVCSLLLTEESTLRVLASVGYDPPSETIAYGLPLDGQMGITVAVVRSGKPIRQQDVRNDPRYVAGGYQALSELCVPLRAGGRTIGALNVESDRLDAFGAADQKLLVTLADVAAVALESARTYRQEQRRAAEMTALYHLGVALVTERDPSTIASRIFGELHSLMGVQTAVIGLVDSESDSVQIYGIDLEEPIVPFSVPLDGDSLSAYVVRRREPFMVGNLSTADLPVRGVQVGSLPSSWLGVPLRAQDQIIGALSIQSAQPDAFRPDQERLLTQIADQVAPVLENARLDQETKRRLTELETLMTVSASVSSDLSLDHVLPLVAEKLALAVGATSCAISGWDQARGTVTSIAQYLKPDTDDADSHVEDLGRPYLLSGYPATEAVLRTGNPLIVHADDPAGDPAERAILESNDWKCLLALPMAAHGRTIGLVELYHAKADYHFSAGDIRLAQALANQAAVAIQQAQLFEETRRRLAREQQLNALAHALGGEMELEQLIPRLLPLVAELTGTNASALALLDKERATIHRPYSYNLPDWLSTAEMPAGEWLSGITMDSGESIVIEDYASHPAARADWVLADVRSMVSVPLYVDDQVTGALGVFSLGRALSFDRDAVRAAEAAARLASVAIQRARLFQAERLRRQEAEALRQASLLLGATLDIEQIMETLLQQVGAVIPYDHADVFWLEGDVARLVNRRVGSGTAPDRRLPVVDLRLDEAPNLRQMVITRKPFVIPNVVESTYWTLLPETEWIRSWAGAPISVRDQVIGFFSLTSAEVGRFSHEQAELLATFATHAGAAVENARLYQAEQRRAEHVAALNRITQGLASGLSFAELFRRFVPTLQGMIPCDRVSIALLDSPDKPRNFTMHAIHDLPDAPLGEGVTMPVSASAAAADVLAGRTHQTPDLAAEVSFPAERALYETGLRARVNLPLVSRGRVIGTLNLVRREPGDFYSEMLPLLQQVADSVAAAVENAQLYQAVRLQAAHLEEMVRQRTAELQAERDRTQAILDSAAEGVIVTDLQGSIQYLNPAAERLTGYSVEEAIGNTPALWKSGLHSTAFYQQMWQTILEGTAWEGELVNRAKSGAMYDALVTIAPIPGADSRPVGFVGIQQDVSQRKELDRMKDRFVSNISHELRTPLTNLKLYLNLLEMGRPEKQAQYLHTLQREAERLHQLIEDLLGLSRLEVGSTQPHLVPTDLNQLVSQLVQDRAALAAERGLLLNAHLWPQPVEASVDAKMLMRVITNLTTNAVNYTPPGGRVDVQTAVNEEGWTSISVTDTGFGIGPEEQAQLFERFYRGQAADQTGAPGTGLGLAICRDIVSLHKGRITLDSELGRGSTFTVWLPAAQSRSQS